ncbi:MAG: DUF2156 domain-containing protein [Deltaproteobacteria bacterium]|nr:DUF2156 domain-containing protein [Deltaproteobacteria bacterium]MBZ0219453.1 DUF2156 domain-containing protein [Deltaproteobacteria bacterium]
MHQALRGLEPEISEFTFANLYLFRKAHGYMLSILPDGSPAISGEDDGAAFFILPAGLPPIELLTDLFQRFVSMKCVTEERAKELSALGFSVAEDRDNFDYLYSREELSKLAGRRYHRKKNLVNYFTGRYRYEARPLLPEHRKDALRVLDEWRAGEAGPGDYEAAKEGLELSEELGLCGGIYFVEARPAAYTLGEELNSNTFVIHFEKGVPGFKGLLQFVNRSFASILPDKYRLINREQDLGLNGLRKAKTSYRPVGFVKKYRAFTKRP